MARDTNPGVTLGSCSSLSPVASGRISYRPSTFFGNVKSHELYKTPSEAKAPPRWREWRARWSRVAMRSMSPQLGYAVGQGREQGPSSTSVSGRNGAVTILP